MNYMGGVDMTDQYTLLYDINRKSTKWWKRVFQRLLLTAVTNAWILHKDLKRKKVSLIDFMIPLAEDLMEIGKSGSKIQRSMKTGRPSKRSKSFVNVQHLPVPSTKRRCRYCASKNLQKRTSFFSVSITRLNDNFIDFFCKKIVSTLNGVCFG
ncbi:PiggyBac transposable element-derived protein 4 [Pseudolycoriella hygida]|uniref:PiggyBac transposable element-derived protein 4 n=1 Tax=Pseudolycoriella hygida TaxID=35572 RepID=A0A9Q0S7G4_9DIPT|nr:PiggyBac transposable element-derived protein 4 [Pseudolycoriella hygida]